jgi:hypothetical protein
LNGRAQGVLIVITGAALLVVGLPVALLVSRVGWLIVAVGVVLLVLVGPTAVLIAASSRALRPPVRRREHPITFLAWLWSTVKLTGERGRSDSRDDRRT